MGLLRAHAAEWHIDPARIGILGFSAAGHIAAALSTHFDHRLYPPVDAADQQSCRPDFTALVYPGYLIAPGQFSQPNPGLQPTAATPPTLLIQAQDDPIGVENSTTWFLALKRAHVPAELHIYPSGGHGYGLRPTPAPVNAWPKAMLAWLHATHILAQ
jgi:acetyl esterase/lipase